jgi:rhamnogalacturonan acetylesterase
MRPTTSIIFATMAARALATPRVFLIGDSTMASGGGGSNTQGWGEYLKYSLNIAVLNYAVAGRSARSYTDEGRFNTVAAAVVSGDFVIIE